MYKSAWMAQRSYTLAEKPGKTNVDMSMFVANTIRDSKSIVAGGKRIHYVAVALEKVTGKGVVVSVMKSPGRCLPQTKTSRFSCTFQFASQLIDSFDMKVIFYDPIT